MKQYFVVSLCKNGVLGGGIVADETAITYRTGKVTVPKEYRALQMNYREITGAAAGRKFGFPIVDLTLTDGRQYRFLVFAQKRFLTLLRQQGVAVV